MNRVTAPLCICVCVVGDESIGDDDSSGGGGNIVYKGSAEPMLVLPSNSYSDDEISVSDSRYSSCPAYTDTDYFTLLPTTLKSVNDFVLRRTFYSKQGFKNTCYSSA